MYSPAYGKSRVTILCVDDDERALLVRKMVLESAGYIVFTAASSSKGLEIFKQHHADLVITDHCLDVGTAGDLAGELRKLSPTLPIMTLSGSDWLVSVETNCSVCRRDRINTRSIADAKHVGSRSSCSEAPSSRAQLDCVARVRHVLRVVRMQPMRFRNQITKLAETSTANKRRKQGAGQRPRLNRKPPMTITIG